MNTRTGMQELQANRAAHRARYGHYTPPSARDGQIDRLGFAVMSQLCLGHAAVAAQDPELGLSYDVRAEELGGLAIRYFYEQRSMAVGSAEGPSHIGRIQGMEADAFSLVARGERGGGRSSLVVDRTGRVTQTDGWVSIESLPHQVSARNVQMIHKRTLERANSAIPRVLLGGLPSAGKTLILGLLEQRWQAQGIRTLTIPEWLRKVPPDVVMSTISTQNTIDTERWALGQHAEKQNLIREQAHRYDRVIVERFYPDPLFYAYMKDPAFGEQLSAEAAAMLWEDGLKVMLVGEPHVLVERRAAQRGIQEDPAEAEERRRRIAKMDKLLHFLVRNTGTVIIDTTRRAPDEVADLIEAEFTRYYTVPAHPPLYPRSQTNRYYRIKETCGRLKPYS